MRMLRTTCARAIVVFAIALVALLCQPARSRAHLQSSYEANAWRGLVPLRATRRDVEGLLGSPQTGGSSYDTDDGRVWVFYSDGPCEKGWPYGWNVEKDTVVSIYVSPKNVMMFEELHLDPKKYQISQEGHIVDRLRYFNQKQGITIHVNDFTKRVQGFTYGPTAADSALQCPDAANRLPVGRTEADPLFKLDVYGDLAPAGERERLDSVAAQLKLEPDSEAYLIAYAGRVARKGEAAARASCARDYLIGKHHIDPARIRAIDGGYQESLLVEIYLEAKDGDVQLALPTVRPSKVQITQERAPKCALRSENQIGFARKVRVCRENF